MGLSVKNFTKKVIHFKVLYLSQDICINMVDSVETTTPTVEVAANGASENETEEVSETTAAEKTVETENGDSTKEATNGKETETEKEATNGKEAANGTETETEKASEEEEKVTSNKEETSTEEVAVEGEEATKRKADSPSEDETVEKIAKLKETAAEVVSEAEKKLPEEPLTEAEATAEATA